MVYYHFPQPFQNYCPAQGQVKKLSEKNSLDNDQFSFATKGTNIIIGLFK